VPISIITQTIFKEIIMRKLLLGTTALAAAATLSANAALADVAISGAFEWTYESRSSNVTATDGTTFGTDSEMAINFTNKTDSGLDLTYRVDFHTDGAAFGNDETSLAIAGGFGKVVLGYDDQAADAYIIDESDLIAEDSAPAVGSMSISTGTSAPADNDGLKVAYHLPAMGGLTAGISHTDGGYEGGNDTTSMGAKYAMEAAGASITVGMTSTTTENSTQDIDQESMGLKIVSGDISVILATGQYEANDEERDNSGAAISYAMPNGMTIGAYTAKSEDDLDAGEEYVRSGVEVVYPIASGLKAMINVDDYEYKLGTNADSDGADVSDSGTQSKLTIQATF
jgi:hypothetical protein